MARAFTLRTVLRSTSQQPIPPVYQRQDIHVLLENYFYRHEGLSLALKLAVFSRIFSS